MRMAAEAESAEARAAEWRGRSMEDHERVLLDVLNLSNAIERSKEHPSYRAPLPESRFPWRELRA